MIHMSVQLVFLKSLLLCISANLSSYTINYLIFSLLLKSFPLQNLLHLKKIQRLGNNHYSTIIIFSVFFATFHEYFELSAIEFKANDR